MKDPKKIEAGIRLAVHNCKKREEQMQKTAKRGELSQYYGIGAVIAVGVIGGLGYYIYQAKKGEATTEPSGEVPNNPPNQPSPPGGAVRQTKSLRWIKSLLYYKNGQEEYSK